MCACVCVGKGGWYPSVHGGPPHLSRKSEWQSDPRVLPIAVPSPFFWGRLHLNSDLCIGVNINVFVRGVEEAFGESCVWCVRAVPRHCSEAYRKRSACSSLCMWACVCVCVNMFVYVFKHVRACVCVRVHEGMA